MSDTIGIVFLKNISILGPLWLPYNEDENPENVLDKNLPIKWKNFQAKTEQNLQTENNEKGDNEKTSKKWRRPAKKFVKYQVLGDNNVAVPTHLYKVGEYVIILFFWEKKG